MVATTREEMHLDLLKDLQARVEETPILNEEPEPSDNVTVKPDKPAAKIDKATEKPAENLVEVTLKKEISPKA
jgi:hypothetical protein